MATRNASKQQLKKKPTAAKPAAVKSARKQFSPEQRSRILAEAKTQQLTGNQVAEKYRISPVTYYLWKSKAGKSGRKPGARKGSRNSAVGIESGVREAVRARIREAIPGIVRAEVGLYLDGVLGRKLKAH